MDKQKKKELKKKYAEEQTKAFIATLPFSIRLFEDLFNYLDEILEEHGCDDTLKYTIKFLEDNDLPVEESVDWLRANGGFCDCEALANIEDKISEI
ncbi:MAG: DUF2695 domain-containing protein [Clostridium sp.]